MNIGFANFGPEVKASQLLIEYACSTCANSCPSFVQLRWSRDEFSRLNTETSNPFISRMSLIYMRNMQNLRAVIMTIYDMCKAVDRGMTITDVRVLQKHGGKSGSFVNT